MKVLFNLKPEQRLNLLTLFTVGLLFWISITSLLPVLPAYVSAVGGTIQEVGLVMGSFAVGLLLFRTILGNLADQKGRKLVLLIGTAVVGTAPVGYLLADSVTMLMALRAFHGISIAAFTTGYSSLVVDVSPPKHRGELIGYMSLVTPIGMALGPAVGGYLQAEFSYQFCFAVAAAAGYGAFAFATRVKEDRQTHVLIEHGVAEGRRSYGELITNLGVVVPAIVLSLIGLVFGALASFLPLYVLDLELEFNPGWFYSLAAIASFSIRVFAGRASDSIGRGVFITFSLICYAVSMSLLSGVETETGMVVAAIVEGSGAGLLIPMIVALVSDRTYATERGRVYSICLTGFDLGIALAGPVWGTVALSIGYRSLFSLTARLALVALAVFVTLSNRGLINSIAFAFGRSKDTYALKQ